MKIYETTYKDVSAVAFETQSLCALFLPELGGKCASIKVLESGRELLAQAPGEKYKPLCYGASYVESECSAFDDMFPTIDENYCAQHPWSGVIMPDHGEVCGLSWNHEIAGECLHMWVYSVRFSYRLDKWITSRDGGVHINYRAQNLSGFDFDCLYAAHCMLAAEKGARLELPYKHSATCSLIFSTHNALGGYGSKIAWPCTNDIDFAVTPSKDDRNDFKIFFEDTIPEGWCRYVYTNGSSVYITFDNKKMPYFSVWSNYGSFKDMYNIAIEPCTAPFDRPDIARMHNKPGVLVANNMLEWDICFCYEK